MQGSGAQEPATEDDMTTPYGALERDKMAVWHLNKRGSSTKAKEDGATIMKDDAISSSHQILGRGERDQNPFERNTTTIFEDQKVARDEISRNPARSIRKLAKSAIRNENIKIGEMQKDDGSDPRGDELDRILFTDQKIFAVKMHAIKRNFRQEDLAEPSSSKEFIFYGS
ncbi:unnamed protein product [Nippostrongylus brasiliensis]|uniref:Anoct_dimer domain-containing protein n=1 Tax=Nippostrongylus brasiliensis TaxID=27835 RepID=A0A0N4YM52_NIPBR|nr:unnamed protein product [Nippostrongylus brasiliensis]